MSRSFMMRGVLVLAVVVCSLSMVGCPSKEVVVIDNFPEFSLDKLWSDFVSFFYHGSASSPLEVGDIIVGTGGGGFLRRLIAVNHSGNKVDTETEFVSLAEAIESGSLAANVAFTPDDFAKSGVPLAKAGTMTIDLSGLVLYSKDGVTISISNGTLTYVPRIVLNASFSDNKLVSLDAYTEGDLSLDLNLRIQATGRATIAWETDIIPPITKPFIFYIGPVPVVGTASISLPFGVIGTIMGQASVESGFDTTTHVKVGVRLKDGAWTDLTNLGSFTTNAHPVVITLGSDAGVDVYVKVNAGLKLYGCSNLTGFIQPYLAADAQFIPSPFTFVLTAGINGGIGYELGILDFKLVDKDWYFPGPYWELYRYSIPYTIPTTFTFTLPL